jgi:NAD(P)-dependent dehydrogenase (short-subunit alcohol dehydrogenase family)
VIRKARRKAILIPKDLREEAFCVKLVARTVSELGGLDIVVSNAGRQHQMESIWTRRQSSSTGPSRSTSMLILDHSCRAPHLKPGPTIIATTSEWAYDPAANLFDYAQTKAATMNFVKSLAKQFGPKGIGVNGAAPDPIYTP